MEELKPNGDLVFEDANEGVTIFSPESRKRIAKEAEDSRIRRVLCHEDEPFIIFTPPVEKR